MFGDPQDLPPQALSPGDIVAWHSRPGLVISCERAAGLGGAPAWHVLLLSTDDLVDCVLHDATVNTTWCILVKHAPEAR